MTNDGTKELKKAPATQSNQSRRKTLKEKIKEKKEKEEPQRKPLKSRVAHALLLSGFALASSQFAATQASTPTSNAEKSTITNVERVPVEKIFDLEFKTLNTPPKEQQKITGTYEQYAEGLRNAILVKLGAEKNVDLISAYKNGDKEKIAEALRTTDEKELFTYLGEVFHKDFKATYVRDKILVTSLQDGKFNCYSGTVLLGEVMTDLGKPMSAIEIPGHIFLMGKDYAFETTTEDPKRMTFPRAKLDSRYIEYQELDPQKFILATYSWRRAILENENHPVEALASVETALKIDPTNRNLSATKVALLRKAGRNEEALEFLEETIKLHPQSPSLLIDKINLLRAMGKMEDATVSEKEYGKLMAPVAQKLELARLTNALIEANKAVEANPKDAKLWVNSTTFLVALGRNEEAFYALNRAIELDPKSTSPLYGKADLLRKLGNFDEATNTVDKALTLSQENKDNVAKAQLLGLKSQIFEDMGQKEEAGKYLKQSSEAWEQVATKSSETQRK